MTAVFLRSYVLVCCVVALGSLARADEGSSPDAHLRRVERRSTQLARVVSSELDRARVTGRREQARCLDSVLSQVHAVLRHARWRQGRPDEGRRASATRALMERLERLSHERRRCLGSAAEGTRVTVEIAPWVPRS